MAEDKYSLKFTAIDQGRWALSATSKTADLIPPSATAWAQPPASGTGQDMSGLRGALTGLGLALAGASLEISLLSAEQGRLRTLLESIHGVLSSQRSLQQAINDRQAQADRPASPGEQKAKPAQTGVEDDKLLERLKPAIDFDAAMTDLGVVMRFEGEQRKAMAQANLKMATERRVAVSGASGADLAGVEYEAAKAGVGNDRLDAAGKVDSNARQAAILEFTHDAAITASAFKLQARDAAQMLIGWRTSMNLGTAQTRDLADATSVLGGNLSASEADIGSILGRYGGAATNSGLTPEQGAAFSAALLNAGSNQADAGVAFEKITTVLARGDQATPGQQAAWAQLGLDPKALAEGMQQDAPKTILSVLEALKTQPADKRSGLANALFSIDAPVLRMLQNTGDVERAFGLVADKKQYASSELGDKGAVNQTALELANGSQARLNAFNAQVDRLHTAVGTTLLPLFNTLLIPLGAVGDGMSSFAETFPMVTAGLVLAGGIAAKKLGGLVKDKALGTCNCQCKDDYRRLPDRTGKRKPASRRAPTPRGPGKSAGGSLARMLGMARLLGSSIVSTAQNSALRLQFALGALVSRATTLAGQAKVQLGTAMSGLAARGSTLKGLVATRLESGLSGAVARSRRLGSAVKGTVSRSGPRLLGQMARAGRLAGSVAKPLMLVSAGIDVVNGLRDGDARMVGSGLGSAGGGLAGTYAGAATGAAIGTLIFPGVGTAIGGVLGGAVGGFAGGEAGSWLGDKLGALVDRLSAPDQVSKDLASAQPDNRQINFAPVFQISGQDQTSAQQLANTVIQQMQAQFVPLMMADPLAVRRGAALTDGGV